MRAVELADRHLVSDHAAKVSVRKPAVEMKGRRLDLERGLAQVRQIEIDRMVGRRADRRRHTGEHRQRRAMNMAGGDEFYPRMVADDRRKIIRIEQILAIHVPDTGDERRMVQEYPRRPLS